MRRDITTGFVELAKSLKYIELGRCSMSYDGNWFYEKGYCDAVRIYNRGLTDQEVKANYEKTIEFHDYVTQNKKI